MKFEDLDADADHQQSRPARGAWVEIRSAAIKTNHEIVAPRKGRVG